jgi:hypothetical protein
LLLFAPPQVAHFFAASQQVIEGSFVQEAPVFEDQNMVGPAEDCPAVGDDQAGSFDRLNRRGVPERWRRAVIEPFPQKPLCFYVQGTGKVVEDKQVGLADEHAGSGRSLSLAT